MSTQKSKSDLHMHRVNSVNDLNNYINSLIESGDPASMSKADKLCYWLSDWTTFLDFESQFNPSSLRRYKRGEIIKVHLGFNVGSEEGGLHYAVVLDKDNAKSFPVVTIAPLTSVKKDTDIHKLRSGSIYIGNELYNNLKLKLSTTSKHLSSEMDSVLKLSKSSELTELDNIQKKLSQLHQELSLVGRVRDEVNKLKLGSIALVNQVTTISKIRIYDPKTDHDILSGIKLSDEKLDLIDAELLKRYTKGNNF